jgi:hypothetical protein
MSSRKVYLGDSVYADWEEGVFGTALKLTTENGHGPTNTIYLDHSVLRALDAFRTQTHEGPAVASADRRDLPKNSDRT